MRIKNRKEPKLVKEKTKQEKGIKWENLNLPSLSGFLLTVAIIVSVIGAYVFNHENPLVTTISFLPVVVIVLIARRLVRRSEVSSWLMLFALLWGAVGSIVMTLSLGEYAKMFLFGGEDVSFETLAVVNAPLTEELSKGVFLIGLMFILPHLIRNPLVGGVVGGLVGAGFAYTENLLYLNGAADDGALWHMFLLRCVISWFLHAMATMFIGLFIGHVVNKHYGFWWSLFLLNVGFVGGMTIHGLWNGFATLLDDENGWLMRYYLPFWLPLLIVFAFAVWGVRKRTDQIIALIYENFVEHGFIFESTARKLTDKHQRSLLVKEVGKAAVAKYENLLFIIDFYDRKAIKNYDKPRRYKSAMSSREQAVERFSKIQNSLSSQ